VGRTPCSFSASRPAFHRAVARATARLAANAVPWTMRFGADRCKRLRHFLVPRADFAWNSRVQAISPAAKVGIPDRLGHARGHASALSPSVADP
jgi:hypothetical protein